MAAEDLDLEAEYNNRPAFPIIRYTSPVGSGMRLPIAKARAVSWISSMGPANGTG